MDPQKAQDDPAAAWRAVLDAVGQSNAAAWMDHFHLQSVDPGPTPGRAVLVGANSFVGEARHVATAARLQRVGDTLGRLLGKPFSVDLVRSAAEQLSTNGVSVDASPASPESGLSVGRGPSAAEPPGAQGQAPGHLDRRDALNLPLVRDVLELFPDAMLIGARKAAPADTANSAPAAPPQRDASDV